jgi:hypothetical protein
MPQYLTLIINRAIGVCKKTGKPNKSRKSKNINQKNQTEKKTD